MNHRENNATTEAPTIVFVIKMTSFLVDTGVTSPVY